MIDIKGQKFGKLTVIKATKKRKNNEIVWKCQCDCGNTKYIRSSKIRYGETRSCGCLSHISHSKVEDRVVAIKKRLYDRICYRSDYFLEKQVELSFDVFSKIIEVPCHYCGRTGVTQTKDSKARDPKKLISDTVLYHNGVDRVDSKLGYLESNSVPCCTACNFAKHRMTYEEFRNWVKLVYQHFVLENVQHE